MFQPRTIVQTTHLLSASVCLSLGGRLYDPIESGEDPILRIVQGSEIKSIFQFLPDAKNRKVKDILEAVGRLRKGEEGSVNPQDPSRKLLGVLTKRDELHRLFETTMKNGDEVSCPEGYMAVGNTELAAALWQLGFKPKGATKIDGRVVRFFLPRNDESELMLSAWNSAWETYLLDEDHDLYHFKGVMENRKFLIRESRKVQVMVTRSKDGVNITLPADASKEQLENILYKLGV